MIKSLDFYFDFISPYSYLAYKKIKKLKENEKIKVNYFPIVLGALHNLNGIKAAAFINAKAKFMIRDCKMVAKKFNINFKFNSYFPINSLYLMRGILVINKKTIPYYIENFFNAYWKDALNLSDEKIVNQILVNSKIEIKPFYKNIKKEKIKNKLKKLTQDAFNKGVFGAPTFIVNKKIFWGQDRLTYALDEYNKY